MMPLPKIGFAGFGNERVREREREREKDRECQKFELGVKMVENSCSLQLEYILPPDRFELRGKMPKKDFPVS